jgi:iron complex outermembrane receptor protein
MKMPSTTLDTIVVTSNPLLPQTNEMATATSIITGDTLDSQVNSTLGDALENEIGVSTDSFGQGASRPIIRGQSAPRVQVMQNSLSVQDASQISPDHQISVPVLGARQIEVIKGTSALMYGGGAIGGVVNIIDDTIPNQSSKKNLSGKVSLIGQQATDGYLGYAELNGSIGDNWLWSGRYQKTDKGNIQVPHWDTDEISNSWYTQENGSMGLSYVTDLGYIGGSYQHQSSEYGLPFHVHSVVFN